MRGEVKENRQVRASNLRRRAWHFAQAALLLVAIVASTVASMGASDPQSRFNDLGHKMICQCGCNQVMLECNHVGCPVSPVMRNELMAGIARGDSDNLILQSFVQKYGPTVLGAPTSKGFNLLAWIMPFAVLLLGLVGTALLVRKWKLHTVEMPRTPDTPGFKALRERIRRDTEV